MTAKEKASELVQRLTDELFNAGHEISKPLVKQCVLICCDEIIEAVKIAQAEIEEYWDFWQSVKTEIENL